jgi:hypothetical protein
MSADFLGGAKMKITAVDRRDTGRGPRQPRNGCGLTRRCSMQATRAPRCRRVLPVIVIGISWRFHDGTVPPRPRAYPRTPADLAQDPGLIRTAVLDPLKRSAKGDSQ